MKRGTLLDTNYILIDNENVQLKDLPYLDAEHFEIFVFVGASQKKIDTKSVVALQPMGDRAKYIQIAGNGPNALDFHIAFYLGQLTVQHPTAHFYIISKDTGFDPLIKHLEDKNMSVSRLSMVSNIPSIKFTNNAVPDMRLHNVNNIQQIKPTKIKSPVEMLPAIIANLKLRGESKPRTVKTLSSTINASFFQNQLQAKDLDKVINKLQNKGVVIVSNTKVSYTFPEESIAPQ